MSSASNTTRLTPAPWYTAPRPDDGVSHLSFKNADFLRAYGLTPRNVLEYFYGSPFYAHCGGLSSVNEARRRGGSKAVAAGSGAGDAHEFVLAYCNDDGREGSIETSVFVVQKTMRREGQDGTVPGEAFYIVAGTIYKAPHLATVFDKALQVTVQCAEQILALQVDDLRRKRRRLDDAVFEGSSRHDRRRGTADGEADGGVAPKWPPWCVFEWRPLPSQWVREAMRPPAPPAPGFARAAAANAPDASKRP